MSAQLATHPKSPCTLRLGHWDKVLEAFEFKALDVSRQRGTVSDWRLDPSKHGA
jgi:hypothetical protein